MYSVETKKRKKGKKGRKKTRKTKTKEEKTLDERGLLVARARARASLSVLFLPVTRVLLLLLLLLLLLVSLPPPRVPPFTPAAFLCTYIPHTNTPTPPTRPHTHTHTQRPSSSSPGIHSLARPQFHPRHRVDIALRAPRPLPNPLHRQPALQLRPPLVRQLPPQRVQERLRHRRP
jgi:hypothetical protein